jgi:hypothetical protein
MSGSTKLMQRYGIIKHAGKIHPDIDQTAYMGAKNTTELHVKFP